jgi:hypothetical protein
MSDWMDVLEQVWEVMVQAKEKADVVVVEIRDRIWV